MTFPNKKPRVDDLRSRDAAPALHNVPKDFIPLVPPPHTPSEFFTNYVADDDPRRQHQVRAILDIFPPPVPPGDVSDELYTIPFIWPPPPVVNADKLPYSMGQFRQNLDKYFRAQNKSKLGAKDEDDSEYIVAPPLPFPPANFMPYPLRSERAPLTANEVFGMLMDANAKLPRVDMIVALAAASLTDYGNHTKREGFDRKFHDTHFGRKRRRNPWMGGSDDTDEEDDYFDIDTKDYSDSEAVVEQESPRNWEYTEKYAKAKPEASNERQGMDDPVENNMLVSEFTRIPAVPVESVTVSEITNQQPKEIINSNGSLRPKRREELRAEVSAVENRHLEQKHQLYAATKQQLLDQLENVKKLHIGFANSKIYDEELAKMDSELSLFRDQELVRQWFERNYELLKCLWTFYQDLNRTYRDYIQLMTNKLEKLRHFFEYQQQVCQLGDMYDIKSKELAKMYQGMATTDYGAQIKHMLKHQEVDEFERSVLPLVMPGAPLTKMDDSTALVHDYMAMVTPAEFNTITGDVAQQKTKGTSPNKQNHSLKHQIFQLLLYDPMTLGSDTNASDSLTPVVGVPRRGRRTATPSGRGPDGVLAKHLEAALLAKIMKHFSGPQLASNDEYNDDVERLGVTSLWANK